jgi:predicted membrane-bound spermidine synthase
MIEAPESAPPVSGAVREDCVSWLPVRPGVGRLLVLAAVFVCAACGLVYELQLIALADYLVGDTVTQTSIVLSLMVFAMGLGSLCAKRLRRRASFHFGLIEALLALVGGSSAMALYACYLWFGEARPALIGYALVIGVLIGAEMPLLMTMIQRIRAQDAGGAVADLSAVDYVGALLGGLAFPSLLLPLLGQLHAALFTGVVNALAGGAVVLWLFRRDLSRNARWLLLAINGTVIFALLAGAAGAAALERATGRVVDSKTGVGAQTGCDTEQ